MREDPSYRETKEKIRQLVAETDPEWAYERRKSYLKGLMQDSLFWALVYRNNYESAAKAVNLPAMRLARQDLHREMRAVIAMVSELHFTKPTAEKRQDRITEEMIERAKAYPYNQLIEVNSRGMALCPFHDDHHPSFTIKNNFGHCFTCKWTGDTIKFLREKEGVSFGEAVKRLC